MMINNAKKRLYFFAAAYFAFWAKIVLLRWRPRTIVVTGSAGKTSLLHLAEAQLQEMAIYTHHANSTFGIPFFILGMNSGAENRLRWPLLFLKAPFCIFRTLPTQNILVAEADAERPREAEFLAKLLKPEVTLWVSVFKTHSGNFDKLVDSGEFASHKQAIAHEFGYFAEKTSKLVVANGDQQELVAQLDRAPAEVKKVSLKSIKKFSIESRNTVFTLKDKKISVPGLHPEEFGVNLQMMDELMKYLGLPPDNSYKKLIMPPGRSSVLSGKNNITIIDSTYNTAFGALKVIVDLFAKYPAKHKWLIIGDFLEQGSLEEAEHVKLGEYMAMQKADMFILLGSRTKQYSFPILQKKFGDKKVVAFESPKEVLDFLNKNLKGGEALLFKGSRFLEGVIEQLLLDPEDANNLVRRGKIWTKRRKKWGLPA